METSPSSAAGEARCLEGGARAQAELWNLADLAQLLVDNGPGQVAELSLIHLTNIYCAMTRSQALGHTAVNKNTDPPSQGIYVLTIASDEEMCRTM